MGEGKRRNDSCPCGSGRKFKHCCMNKKPRITGVKVDMGEPVAIDSIRLGPKGEVQMLSKGSVIDPIEANIFVSYDRSKGPKTLLNIPIEGTSLTINQLDELQKYNVIFAVDTNTKVHNEIYISVGVVILCEIKKDNLEYEVTYAPVHTFRFKDFPQNAENLSWKRLIEMIVANPQYNHTLRFGVVVDSDSDNISSYNAREKPIIDDFYLPNNINLIYASADSGLENLPNKLISEADKWATRILNELLKNEV